MTLDWIDVHKRNTEQKVGDDLMRRNSDKNLEAKENV